MHLKAHLSFANARIYDLEKDVERQKNTRKNLAERITKYQAEEREYKKKLEQLEITLAEHRDSADEHEQDEKVDYIHLTYLF